MEIRIISANDQSITVAVEDQTATYGDVLGFQQVRDFFDEDDAAEIRDNFTELNGTKIENIKGTILGCRVEDGAELLVDLFAEEAEAPATAADPAAAVGHVTVRSAGGLAEQIMPIMVGQTTVREAVFSNAVRDRFKMNDTQLSAMDIVVNSEKIVNLDAKTLADGDTIDLSVRAAHDKSR